MTRLALPERFRMAVQGLPADAEVSWYADASQSELAVENADALWHDQLTASALNELLARGPRLSWVFSHNVGVDHVPLDLLARRGIELFNGAGLYAIPIAEHVIMAMLAGTKGLQQLLQAQARHEWLARPVRFGELYGTSAMIIGYGHIGEAIKHRLDAFGVDTVGVRRRSEPPNVLGPGEWRAVLGEFDWIIVSAPLTSQTVHMISAPELAEMKPSAWVVNVSRGQIVDTDALVTALEARSIGGAYLDVTDPEPLPRESPLWMLPNVIITPHTSFASDRFARRAADLFVETLSRFGTNTPPTNRVDLEVGY
jgi:phosphoglycerate dehydrogenase-like enzyme